MTDDQRIKWEMSVYVYDNEGNATKYVWYGGSYVDVIPQNPDLELGFNDIPIDVINVYDYVKGKPEIKSMKQLIARVKRYNKEVLSA